MAGGDWIPWSERRALLDRELRERDGEQCVWCSLVLEPGRETLEHVIPAGRGGPKHADNLILACGRCNNRRGVTPALVHLAALEQAGQPVRVGVVRAAVARTWSSRSFTVGSAAVFELCHEHQITAIDEFERVRPAFPWHLATAPDELAQHYLEEIHRPVELRLVTLAAEVEANLAGTRKQFALEFALRLPRHEQYAAFQLLDGDEESARRSLRRMRTLETLDVVRIGRRFPAAAQSG